MKFLIMCFAVVAAVLLVAPTARAAEDWDGCLMSDYAAAACADSPAMIVKAPPVVAEVDLMELESEEAGFPGDAPEYALTSHAPDGPNFDDVPAEDTVHVAILIPSEVGRR
jgi:hypothetical protein